MGNPPPVASADKGKAQNAKTVDLFILKIVKKLRS